MDAHALQAYLHRHIPVSQAMGITVLSASLETIVLRAALAPNLNHRSTAFGGRGRLEVQVAVEAEDRPAAYLEAGFVALRS